MSCMNWRRSNGTLLRLDDGLIKTRELGVMFQDLRVVGLGASVSYQSTLGSLFNPLRIIEFIQSIRHPPVRDILSGFEGAVRPGQMLCTSIVCHILAPLIGDT
jgi:ATP-binding cassette subfamily G (WHITE) protein 2 (SNQ2)